jgi:hypothetical protein
LRTFFFHFVEGRHDANIDAASAEYACDMRRIDGQGTSGEGGENPFVGLPWQLPVARFAERRSRSSRCLAEQLVQTGTRDNQESVSRASTRDGESPERRVELVQLCCPGQGMDSDRDAVCLALVGVDR